MGRSAAVVAGAVAVSGVDVLAEIDLAVVALEHESHSTAGLIAARAAVTELIAAAKALEKAEIDLGASNPNSAAGKVGLCNRIASARERFRAAIAKATGEQP